MSATETAAAEFKTCCANFYADDLVRRILGDSFHPGGEALTRQLLEAVEVTDRDRLLDVAAGQGTSAVLAAVERGCDVTAVDLSAENLARAEDRAMEAGVGERFTARRSDAERLPFDDGTFDVVLCECAFCTFVDKPTAAREMARVLRPGGRLTLSDMALVPDELPEDLDTLVMRVACVADALSEQQLVAQFTEVGFGGLSVQDVSWGLTEMVEQIRHRLLAVELASKLGKLELGGLDIAEGKRIARRCLEVIGEGGIRYATLTGVRE